MFKNPGAKIQVTAIIIFILFIVTSICGAIVLFMNDSLAGYGVLVIILGPLLGWITTIGMYAFGELVQKTTENNMILKYITNHEQRKEVEPINEEEKHEIKQVKMTAKDYEFLEMKGCLISSEDNPNKKTIPSNCNKEQLDLLLSYGIINKELYDKMIQKNNKNK